MDSHYKNTDLLVPAKYNNTTKFPFVTKPKIIGHFSIDGDRNYQPNAEQLKYLRLPKPHENIKFDLNIGYENVIHKPESCNEENLDFVLKFLLDNEKEFFQTKSQNENTSSLSSQPLLNYDFITLRGTLTEIMSCPYENRQNIRILATKYRGNIYLCKKETEERKYERINATSQSKRICSYGFKFEQFVLSEHPQIEPFIDKPVNEIEEFCCALETTLGSEKFKLLYVAEMDGINKSEKLEKIDKNTNLNEFEFVEVKTRIKSHNPRQENSFRRFILRKWWCQNFLVGINRSYVGFRNDAGIVTEIKEFTSKDMHELGKDYWSSGICVNFLIKFLNMIKNQINNIDCPYTVYEYYWKVDNSRMMYTFHQGKNFYSFLPQWYIDVVEKYKMR